MRHDFPYVHTFRPVLYDDHDAVIVSGYVEYQVGRHIVSGIVELPNMTKIPEFSLFNNRMPLSQLCLGSRVFLPELTKDFQRDNVHERIISY